MTDWREEWKKRGIPEEEWPIEHMNEHVRVTRCHRCTAEENQPGRGSFYCNVFKAGLPVGGVKIRFETEPSEGVAYDHPDVWGVTGTQRGNLGYVQYDHPRISTRYEIYVDEVLVLSNVRLDLGNEYMRGGLQLGTWRPINRPGTYSYDIEFEIVDGG